MHPPHIHGRASSVVLTIALGSLAMSGSPGSLAASPGASGGAAHLPPTSCPAGTVLGSGMIATIAGGGPGASGYTGPALGASLISATNSTVVDASGGYYLGDHMSGDVRRIGADGTIATVSAGWGDPQGIALDAAGDLYFADNTDIIRRLDPSGSVTTFAGTGVRGSTGNDGLATQAEVNPSRIAVGPKGDLYFDDMNNYRRVDTTGVIHAFAGSTTAGFAGDGGPAVDALLGEDVGGIAADQSGNVYLADAGNHRIRKVDTAGIITTIAGTGDQGTSGDGGQATAAMIDTPVALTVDDAGSLYLADYGPNTVRRIDPSGTISTVAGTGTAGFSGDCGPATAAQLNQPQAIAVHDGVLYIYDSENGRVRVVMP